MSGYIRRVFQNSAWNVAGTLLPMLAGLLAVPMLLKGLGDTRMGIFSLALALIGFSGILDLGLGRALTQTVAREMGEGSSEPAIAELVRKALVTVLSLGMVWGLMLCFLDSWIVHDVLRLDGSMAAEALVGVYCLAFILPVVLLTSCLAGVLEGLQRFRQANFVRGPLGVAGFIIPAGVAYSSGDLGLTMSSIAVIRLCGLAAWYQCLVRSFGLFSCNTGLPLAGGKMWRFTGWLSISNVVSPLMVYADRYYLASLFPAGMVAHYTVPLDTLLRGTWLPLSAVNAIYPAISNKTAPRSEVTGMLRWAGISMMAFWFVPLFLVGLVMRPLLVLWVGPDFSAQIFGVTQWLLVGVLANGFAFIPYALLQGAGRADLTAKLHLLELPLYAVVFVFLVGKFGVFGAAIAWFLRVLFDTFALYGLALLLFRKFFSSLWLVFGLASAAILCQFLALVI